MSERTVLKILVNTFLYLVKIFGNIYRPEHMFDKLIQEEGTMQKYLNNPGAVAAIFPVYKENGDETMVIYQDGSHDTVPLKVRTVINRLAKLYSLDLLQLKKKTEGITQRSLYNPIVMSPSVILVPVKTRKPRVTGDSTLSYINLPTVKKISPSTVPDCRSQIKLTDNYAAECLWTPATVRKRFKEAELLSSNLLSSLPWGGDHKTNDGEFNSLVKKLVTLCCDIIKMRS